MPSETAISGQAKAALLLLLTGVICNAGTVRAKLVEVGRATT